MAAHNSCGCSGPLLGRWGHRRDGRPAGRRQRRRAQNAPIPPNLPYLLSIPVSLTPEEAARGAASASRQLWGDLGDASPSAGLCRPPRFSFCLKVRVRKSACASAARLGSLQGAALLTAAAACTTSHPRCRRSQLGQLLMSARLHRCRHRHCCAQCWPRKRRHRRRHPQRGPRQHRPASVTPPPPPRLCNTPCRQPQQPL